MKVGILTYYSSINYGAYLQAYALCSSLNKYDAITAEIIQLQTIEEVNYYKKLLKPRKNIFQWLFDIKKYYTFKNSKKKLSLSERHFIANNIEEQISFIESLGYDAVISGSDEIWTINGLRGYPTAYFLCWKTSFKKLAYAVSGRTDFQGLNIIDLDLFRDNLSTFSYIGVRDGVTFNNIKSVSNNKVSAHSNLDPTFIYDFKPNKENGLNILKKHNIDTTKRIIGFMFSEKHPRKPELLNYIKKNTSSNIEFVSIFEWTAGAKNIPDLTPLEWVDVISALDGIVTMYFHACCFAIMFKIPFFAVEIRSKDCAESKIWDLLIRFHLTDFYSFGVDSALRSQVLLDVVSNGNMGTFDSYDSIISDGKKEFENMINHLKDN